MRKLSFLRFRAVLLLCILAVPAAVYSQRERQIPTSSSSSADEGGDYGGKFFDQLRSIFGRFRDAELQRAFQVAEPIQCSELVVDKGEWRPVAFFNDDRKLGDWYRSNIEEVKTDLSVYIFKGACRADRDTLQLTTKFPVGESIDALNAGRIPLDQVDVNVNAPVPVTYDTRSRAYIFDLPYLFLLDHEGGKSVYSLQPTHLADHYVTDITNHWECKAVRSDDVTYRFLICRTSTAPRYAPTRNQTVTNEPGSAAYFILSDGREARSSVQFAFGDVDVPVNNTPDVPATAANRPSMSQGPQGPPEPASTSAPGGWERPYLGSPIANAGKSEFRIRFNPEAWKGKIAAVEVLFDERMSGLTGSQPPNGADHCDWVPGGSASLLDRLMEKDPDDEVSFTLLSTDRGSQSAASVEFDMKTHTGTRLGKLQCLFPHTDAAADISLDRWMAVVGTQLTLEIRR